jgi:hypothetical protein
MSASLTMNRLQTTNSLWTSVAANITCAIILASLDNSHYTMDFVINISLSTSSKNIILLLDNLNERKHQNRLIRTPNPICLHCTACLVVQLTAAILAVSWTWFTF